MMAGAHLGNGNIDLELLYHNDSRELLAKEDRAHKRYLTQQRRQKRLKAQISQKKPLVSKGSRGTSGAYTKAATAARHIA
mmetsp:Transcript_16358/g.19654  ORF Transcript_16358/g.19654 Transcript_16358/m.19654 type:complete len:80 (+) Transcript_16358:17-256(+)